MDIFRDINQIGKKNKGAFSGRLNCPLCQCEKHQLIEKLTPWRFRYRCRKCHQTFQYDCSGLPDHPYAPFKKASFQEIIRASQIKPRLAK